MSRARELDQFYTRDEVAQQCMESLMKAIKPAPDTIFLEPSAGAGAFFKLLPKGRRVGVDLEPKCPGVRQGDFLTFEWPANKPAPITVGNPPFGKNASLAVKFFNHAAQFSSVVAFVVPKTFRKRSLVKRLNDQFICEVDIDLPSVAFTFEGEPYGVPACFQVWRKSKTKRIDKQLPTSHPDFSFVDRASADFAFRRVGAVAGKVLREFDSYSETSNYFIKANIPVELLIRRLEAVDWTEAKENNAGNPSISKRELVEGYTRAVRKDLTRSRKAA